MRKVIWGLRLWSCTCGWANTHGVSTISQPALGAPSGLLAFADAGGRPAEATGAWRVGAWRPGVPWGNQIVRAPVWATSPSSFLGCLCGCKCIRQVLSLAHHGKATCHDLPQDFLIPKA